MRQAGFLYRFYRFGQIGLHPFRQHMPFRAHRQIYTIKADLRRSICHIFVIQKMQVFGKDMHF
jgi:hypothetical protein